jgi:predicted membrane-bound spermidine synthase
LGALFFVSGFSAILYQLVWQRKLYALIGINVEVVTLIVTLFIAGLGLGSLAGGVASRLEGRRLISAFAAVELGIGLFGAASPWLFGALGRLAPSLNPLEVATGASLLVLPPTMAMGATLPILVTYLVRRRASVGVAVGTLYCVNTLGSAIAAFMVALVLMRWLGQSGVLAIAVLGNLTVGGSAVALRSRLA